MRGHIDKDLCIACGLCGSICPDVFHEDDDGKFTAIDDEIPEDLVDVAKEAEEECPTEAVEVVDE